MRNSSPHNALLGTESLRAAFDALDDLILVVDRDLRIVALNASATEAVGRLKRDAFGCRLSSLGGGEPYESLARLAALCRDTGGLIACKVSDETRTWSIRAKSVEGCQQIVVVARDVTVVSELQRRAHRTETLAALGALVAGVAHEVRNPLFTISSTLDAYESITGGEGAERNHVAVLRAEVDRLTLLMNELFDYGRPAKLDMSTISLSDAIERAIAYCSPTALALDVTVVLHQNVACPLVQGDVNRLERLLRNLLLNAIQHSARGSRVEVEVGHSFQDDELWVDCAVVDRGPGFHEKDIPYIFDPFFTRRRGGIGLGLAIVQRIAHEHHARLAAANRPGGGAIVLLCLPGIASTTARVVEPKAASGSRDQQTT